MAVTETNVPQEQVDFEFTRSTERFHVITCWIGLSLNLVWFVSDYFVLPEHWFDFLLFRVGVSTISFITVLFRKKINFSIYVCMFILVLGISIQNAYMWSVMDLKHMQMHTFAYLALFIGAGMLVLWEFRFSIVIIIATIISNIIFHELNSKLTLGEFMINGGMLTFSVVIFGMFLIRTRYRLTYNEIRSRLELAYSKELIEKEHKIVISQKHEIEAQKEILEEKNKEITDSINYAQRIQSAFIPSEKEFTSHFPESFVLFQPKDIVSGDFYWILEKGDVVYYVTADCTGHGVPGGFMTMLGLSYLEEIITANKVTQPDIVLNYLRDKIVNTLKQTGTAGENKDGMDLTLCCLNKKDLSLTFSSANNSLYIQRKGEMIEYKGDKQPCGFYHEPKPFQSQSIKLEKGDSIFTFTDGYADQFGGPKGKKFLYRNLENILNANAENNFGQIKEVLSAEMKSWIGKLEQVDDILVIGVKIN